MAKEERGCALAPLPRQSPLPPYALVLVLTLRCRTAPAPASPAASSPASLDNGPYRRNRGVGVTLGPNPDIIPRAHALPAQPLAAIVPLSGRDAHAPTPSATTSAGRGSGSKKTRG